MSAAKVVPSATSADAAAPLVVGAKSELLVDESGRLIVSPVGGLSGALALQIQGNVAHNDVDAGNPVKVGGFAVATPAGAVAVSAAADRVNAVYDLNGRQEMVPAAWGSDPVDLVVGAAGAPVACAAAGAWTSGGIISPGGVWRRLFLFLQVDPSGGAIGNIVTLNVLTSQLLAAPAANAGTWYALATTGGVWSGKVQAVAPLAGQYFTAAPQWNEAVMRGVRFSTEPVLATANRIAYAPEPIDITGRRHIQIMYAETGVTATPAAITLRYAFGL